MFRYGARVSAAAMLRASTLLALAALACRSDEIAAPAHDPGPPNFVIEDAQHGSSDRRNPHFYWLPPMVPAPNPAPAGQPDPDVLGSLRVDICDLGESRPAGSTCGGKPLIATFTSSLTRYFTTSGDQTVVTTATSSSELVRFEAGEGLYLVNWHTDKTPLLTTHYYRIRVLAAGIELGQADIDVLRTARDLKNYDTGNSIPLVDGRTLPIKVRIERGAIALVEPGGEPAEVGAAGATVATKDGAVAVKIPADAVPAGTKIAIEPADDYPPGPESWSPVYELTTDAAQFNAPVTVSLAVDFDELPEDVPPTALALYVATEDGWDLVAGSTVNLDENTVSAPTTHFSIYAVRIVPNTFTGSPDAMVLPAGSIGDLQGFTSSYQLQNQSVCWIGSFGRTCRTYATVTHYPEASAIDWTSSAPGVAVPEPARTYTSSGGVFHTAIRAVAPGVAIIRARTPEGVMSNPVTVTVFAPVASVAVTPSPAQAIAGRTLQLTATLSAADNSVLTDRPIHWSSSDPGVATVTSSGLLTGLVPGSTTISAESEGKVGTSLVTVVLGPPISWQKQELHIAQFQGGGSNITVAEAPSSNLSVTITHLRPGVTTSNAAHPILAGQTAGTGGLSIRGGMVGRDTLVTSAVGYSSDSLIVVVSPLGRILLQGWPTELAWGDSTPVQLRILDPDGAFGQASTAIAEVFQLASSSHLAFSNGSAPITSVTVAEGVQSSGTFYVKHVAPGTGTVTVSNPHYESHSASTTVHPFRIGGFDASRAVDYSFPSGQALATARSIVTNSFANTTLSGFPTLTASALAGVDMVVLSGLRSNIQHGTPLTASEQSALLGFVTGGGCALLLAEGGAADISITAPFGITQSGGLNNAVTFTVTAPASSPITSGPFGTVSTFIGNFVSAYATLGSYAVSRATTGAGIGLAEIPPGAIGPGSGRVVAIADANAFSNDLGFISDGRNQALLRNIVAACR